MEKEPQQLGTEITLDNLVVRLAAISLDDTALVELITRRCFVTVCATKEGGLIFTNQASGEQWIATAKN